MRKYILTAVFFAVPAMAHATSLETIETGINTAVESENAENAHGITASIFDGAKTGGKDVVAVNAAGGENTAGNRRGGGGSGDVRCFMGSAPEVFVWSALAGGAAGAIAAAVRGGDATEIIEDGLRGFALGFVALPVLGAGALLAKLF